MNTNLEKRCRLDTKLKYVLIKAIHVDDVVDTLGLCFPKICSKSNIFESISQSFVDYTASNPNRPVTNNRGDIIDYSNLYFDFHVYEYQRQKFYLASYIRNGVIFTFVLFFLAGSIYSILSRIIGTDVDLSGKSAVIKVLRFVKCFDVIDNLKPFWPKSYYMRRELDWINGFRSLKNANHINKHLSFKYHLPSNFQDRPPNLVSSALQRYK